MSTVCEIVWQSFTIEKINDKVEALLIFQCIPAVFIPTL